MTNGQLRRAVIYLQGGNFYIGLYGIHFSRSGKITTYDGSFIGHSKSLCILLVSEACPRGQIVIAWQHRIHGTSILTA
jgi:hypothetical protein